MGFVLKVDDELSLRLVEPHHADEMFAVADANRAYIARWLPWMTPGYSIDDARQYTERALREFAERKSLPLSVMVGGRVAGGLGLNRWQQGKFFGDTYEVSSAEIGYWLAEGHAGRGLMTRAVRALTTFAFQTYGIQRLEIRAEPENQRSRAVAERLGYRLEGTLRDVSRHNGRAVDLCVYAMLAGEWTP